MNITKIKGIPNYVLGRIKRLDKKNYPKPNGHTRYYTYLTKIGSEICKITVAVRHRYSKWLCKQCAVHGKDSKNAYCKDMTFYYITGYLVGWNNEINSKYKNWYETGVWEELIVDYVFDPYAIPVNNEFIRKIPKYKYSGLDYYKYNDTIKYLRLYDKYPQIEYLSKMGLSYYAFSSQILKKCTDKKFCKWLYKNKNQISLEFFNISVILKAYKQNKDLYLLQQIYNYEKYFKKTDCYKTIKPYFTNEIEKLALYIKNQKTTLDIYDDYFKACLFLNIDITLPKNRYPKDFKYWHDIRIDEYNTAKINQDKEKRKELYNQFKDISDKYLSLQKENSEYTTLIAKSPAELIIEGEKLHHCVGKMNYDQKFVREETLIFFIRLSSSPAVPLVTLEYSPIKHKIIQIHGDHNSIPNENILYYINKVWLPYANKKVSILNRKSKLASTKVDNNINVVV